MHNVASKRSAAGYPAALISYLRNSGDEALPVMPEKIMKDFIELNILQHPGAQKGLARTVLGQPASLKPAHLCATWRSPRLKLSRCSIVR